MTKISKGIRSVLKLENGAFLLMAMGVLGCSEVQFTPSGSAQQKIPDSELPPNERQRVERPHTQTFEQEVSSGKVDILFVEDTSISMYSNRFRLFDGFSSFQQDLGAVDWQIGVTSNDMGGFRTNGKLLSHGDGVVLTPDSRSLSTKFDRAISMLQCNEDEGFDYLQPPCMVGNEEETLEASLLAVNDSSNQDLFRGDASLAVVYVTNEDEGNADPDTRAAEVFVQLRSAFSDGKKIRIYGLAVTPGDQACLAEQDGSVEDEGARYAETISKMAEMSGGSVHSICERSFAPLLQDVAQGAAKSEGRNVFVLDHEPLDGSVNVTLVPHQEIVWFVQGRNLIFLKPPAPGTTIEVNYEY
jgi:hypothetical protein